MKKLLLISFLLLSGLLNADAQSVTQAQKVSIIPLPQHVKELPGKFLITASTKIYTDPGSAELKKVGEMLAAEIKNQSGLTLSLLQKAVRTEKNAIILTLKNAPDTLGDEGYLLSVRPERIVVNAPAAHGAFYGIHSILQLITPKAESLSKAGISVPAVDISDKPRFGWRGLMLDAGRYFYSVDFIKKYIDYIAMHKMNTFHWHLTEDHGWRIEIKSHPKLTEISSKREGTQYARAPHQINHNPHWGYYTQDDIREVIAYAQERYVNVVPEIELPGHSLSALVAYPQLSCTGGPFKIPVQWGIQKDIYCAGNEETFKFLEDVLTEVAALFPSPIIHIGGDEAPKDRWKACPKCQARIKVEGLKDEHELQSYFIQRIEKFLQTKNKRIIGWDEILEGGLAPNATVMSWRGTEGGIAAAKQHHDVIMTPNNFMYLDYYQGEPYLEPPAIGGFLPLEKVYSYEPIPKELTAKEAQFIKGVQGNVWCEYIHSSDKVEYMAFPRAAAVAEVGWTQPQLKNWENFTKRMETQYQRYADMNMNYSTSAYNVYHTVNIDSAGNKASVTLNTNSYQPEIRYTIDGSDPTPQSPVYSKEFEIKMPATVKAATFKNGKRISEISARSVFLKEQSK